MAHKTFKNVFLKGLPTPSGASSGRVISGVEEIETNIDQLKEANVGDTVQLQCSVNIDHDYSLVYWVKISPESKDEDILIAAGDVLLVGDGRFSVQMANNNYTYSFSIRNAQDSDSGLYSCRTYYSVEKITARNTRLTVKKHNNESPHAILHSATVPVLTEENVSISNITQKQLKQAGESLELFCTVENGDNYPVVWSKKTDYGYIPIASGGKFVHVRDGRHSTSFDEVSSTYYLKIDNLDEEDEGVYRCEFETLSRNKVSKHVIVKINYPNDFNVPLLQAMIDEEPRIVRVSPPQYKSTGDEVTLSCQAENIDKEPVIWTKDNEAVASNDVLLKQDSRYHATYDKARQTYYLTIRNLTPNDAGKYMCSIFDPDEDDAETSQTVEVHVGPISRQRDQRASITSISPSQARNEGETAQFSCVVENYRGAYMIRWWKNENYEISNGNRIIISDPRFSLKMMEVSASSARYDLTITDLRADDSGAYTCEALRSPDSRYPDNKVTRRADLNVRRSQSSDHRGEPHISYISPTLHINAGQVAILRCKAENVPDMPVLWTKDVQVNGRPVKIPITLEDEVVSRDNHYNIVFDKYDSTYRLYIDPAYEDDGGTYSCIIIKSLSEQISQSTMLVVRPVPGMYSPGLNGRTPVITYVSPPQRAVRGSSTTLTCNVQDVQHYPVLWIKDYNIPISINIDSLFIGSAKYIVGKAGAGRYNLTINNLERTDTGTYACVVWLSPKESVVRESRLEVGDYPSVPYPSTRPPLQNRKQPSIVQVTAPQEVDAGREAVLYCQVQDVTEQSVTWSKNGKMISEDDMLLSFDQRISVQKDPASSVYYLKISPVRSEDTGRYKCEIESSPRMGTTPISKETHLTVRSGYNPATPDPRVPAPITKHPECKINEALINSLSSKIADKVTMKILQSLDNLNDEYEKLEEVVRELQREYANIGRDLKRYYKK